MFKEMFEELYNCYIIVVMRCWIMKAALEKRCDFIDLGGGVRSLSLSPGFEVWDLMVDYRPNIKA